MQSLRKLTLRRLTITATLSFTTVALLALSASAAPALAVDAASPAYPDSIAVIGHSFATGEGVAGPRAFRVRNSWVTGDTSAVQSLYSRILARNPAIRGNKFNLAVGGADVASMLLQARKAITMKPAPELVVVQGIDHDITCDATGHRPFQVAFARVLDVLATGLPGARIFVVSQFGSVPTYIKALTLKQRVNQRTRISPGSGPCAFLNARGAPIPKGVAYLEAVIHRYEAAVAAACKSVAACRYDGGAFGRVVERPEYISWDVIHLSAQGQAKAAAVAWAALKRVGIIPSSLAFTASNGAPATPIAQGFDVTSTLDGKSVLPLRLRWLAYPKLPLSRVSRVEFLIDGKVRWIERRSPYVYGSDDDGRDRGFLVTTWLRPGPHRFGVRLIDTRGRRVTHTTTARVRPAPEPPVRLKGMWTRVVTERDLKKSDPRFGDGPPPAGRWKLVFDRVGAWHLDPRGSGVVNQYAAQREVLHVYAPIAMAPDGVGVSRFGHRNLGPLDCNHAGPFGTYRWSVSGRKLTLTARREPCGQRRAIWEGVWTRVR
jgi:hypothetical protein